MLYPDPRGSDSGFRNMSILFFACSGKIKLYINGTDTITIRMVPMIYFLSIPDVININVVATMNAAAVP